MEVRRYCVVCGNLALDRMFTCSKKCHRELIDRFVKEFGEYKKIVNIETGKAHRVPTRVILEHGLKGEDLPKYPLWEDERGMRKVSKEDHIRRHNELHKALDELTGDHIRITGKLPGATNILELMEWSNRQRANPETKEVR